MKVLLVGDSHGNTNFVLQAVAAAEELGVTDIFQVGDFGVWPGLSGELYLQALDATLGRHPELTFSFLDGNHEDFEQLDAWAVDPQRRLPDGRVRVTANILWCPRGTVLNVGGRRIGFLGGAVSVDQQLRTPHLSWWPQEQLNIADVDRLAANGADGLDVLLTHDAPASVDLGFDTAYRDSVLPQKFVRASMHARVLVDAAVAATHPAVVVHGHWHLRHDTPTVVDGHRCRVYGLDKEGFDGLAVLDTDDLTVTFVDETLVERAAACQ